MPDSQKFLEKLNYENTQETQHPVIGKVKTKLRKIQETQDNVIRIDFKIFLSILQEFPTL